MALTTSDSISTSSSPSSSSSSSSSSATLNGPVTKKLPIRLKNYSSNQEYFDSLYLNAKQAPSCSEQGCLGSIMYPSVYKNSTARPKEEVLPLAKDFLDQYYTSIKSYFPHRFNTIENQKYIGPLPGKEFYGPETMSPEDREKFLKWYSEEEEKNVTFDFQKEMEVYCRADVDILRLASLQFRKLFYNLLQVDPLTTSATIASACMRAYRANFLPIDTIPLMPFKSYRMRETQSDLAVRYIRYFETKYKVELQSVYRGTEKKIGKYPVDAYCPTFQAEKLGEENRIRPLILEIHGCYFHGCRRCFPNRTTPAGGKTKYPITMESRYENTQTKMDYLRKRGDAPIVVEKWECEIYEECASNPELKKAMTDPRVITPIQSNREAFFGGRTENFRRYYKVKNNEKIRYIDVNSLYPYVNKYGVYPVGHPDILLDDEIPQDLKNITGIAKVRILPPKKLFAPVLPIKTNGKLTFALCNACATTENRGTCTHTDSEREITGTYTCLELRKAIEKGYKMKEITEVWSYATAAYDKATKSGGLFTGYIDLFLKIKQEASGFPSDVVTDAQKTKFIEELQEREGVTLDLNKIEYNPGLRSLSKLCLNRLNSPAYLARWEQVQKDIENTGSYQLTETELVFGAKLAWRNAARCIGRIQWAKLQVFDCRSVTTTSNMFEAICNHIKYSTNKGNIRSAITIFAQRTDGKHDFRVWNPQLLSYAGYKNPDGTITGDPANVEFTEVCMKLGWKCKRTDFEILPLVLSANGHDPDYFDIPPELILEVNLSHPSYDWFEDLGYKWYCVPAVSSMLFDCGGLQFTACPFNGWYMSTEIACRDLCDPHRYNITERVARKMGLDTRSNMSLWKDKAMVEVNVSVLHSFQMQNITIMDHHTAAESFMKHYENEQRARNGCPADWVWIVPPTSASITPVFHQEMCNYVLHPFYDYQEPAWKIHEWKKNKASGKTNKIQRKFHFKQIARAVKFTSKLFGQALSKRIKATILYATETGKSEAYAQKLGEIFSHAFHSQVVRMDEYDMSSIEHEAVLLVVTSTFGNGDPPENGHSFAQSLYSLKMDHQETRNGPVKENAEFCSASFIKANSLPEQAITEKQYQSRNSFDDDMFGPLGNVRFAVFALGSSAYPNFCAFGTYVDNLLGELGGERLVKVTNGDEMCGQETAFKKWAAEVFKVALETFCLENEDDTLNQIDQMLHDVKISASTVRFQDAKEDTPLNGLASCHNRKITKAVLLSKKDLHKDVKTDRATLLLELAVEGVTYSPGDHVGVFPCNRKELVDGIIAHLEEAAPDNIVELQLLKEKQTSTGVEYIWMVHEKLPACSLRSLLTRYLDITTPPSPNLLRFFATLATDQQDKDKLTTLSSDNVAYEDWRHSKYPHLLDVFQEFPSVKPPAALLVSQLTLLQPRFYSISSSPIIFPNHIHLTVAVVTYNTQDGKGPLHYGVCSNYLQDTADNEEVYIFVRSAPNFHLPAEVFKPLILVGPGTGIAPFRSFWQHRAAQQKIQAIDNLGKVILFFGCRLKSLDLYTEEKQKMVEEGILSETHLALSREPNVPKAYVQDLMKTEAEKLYKQIVTERGHFYVCGDCKMAEDVYQTLRTIIQEKSGMTYAQAESYLLRMRDENRYHEDIFGITLRTAEVHTQSRETARIRMASESIP